MIESVNAAIATAQLSRASMSQTVSSNVMSTASAEISAGVSAPYLSPHVNLVDFKRPIFIVRDLETGAPIRQFPSESQIRAYQRAKEVEIQSSIPQLAGFSGDEPVETDTAVVESSVQFREVRQQAEASTPPVIGVKTGSSDVSAPAPAPVSTGNTTFTTEA